MRCYPAHLLLRDLANLYGSCTDIMWYLQLIAPGSSQLRKGRELKSFQLSLIIENFLCLFLVPTLLPCHLCFLSRLVLFHLSLPSHGWHTSTYQSCCIILIHFANISCGILLTCPYYLFLFLFTHSTTPQSNPGSLSTISNIPYTSSLLIPSIH